MKLLAVLAILGPLACAQDFDIVIRNGRIVDGSGGAAYLGDLAISGGRIVAVGSVPRGKARRVIDASGLVVAPGFIDIHNHSDDSLVADGNAQSMVRQGVTSMILGEGGSRLLLAVTGGQTGQRFLDRFQRLFRAPPQARYRD